VLKIEPLQSTGQLSPLEYRAFLRIRASCATFRAKSFLREEILTCHNALIRFLNYHSSFNDLKLVSKLLLAAFRLLEGEHFQQGRGMWPFLTEGLKSRGT